MQKKKKVYTPSYIAAICELSLCRHLGDILRLQKATKDILHKCKSDLLEDVQDIERIDQGKDEDEKVSDLRVNGGGDCLTRCHGSFISHFYARVMSVVDSIDTDQVVALPKDVSKLLESIHSKFKKISVHQDLKLLAGALLILYGVFPEKMHDHQIVIHRCVLVMTESPSIQGSFSDEPISRFLTNLDDIVKDLDDIDLESMIDNLNRAVDDVESITVMKSELNKTKEFVSREEFQEEKSLDSQDNCDPIILYSQISLVSVFESFFCFKNVSTFSYSYSCSCSYSFSSFPFSKLFHSHLKINSPLQKKIKRRFGFGTHTLCHLERKFSFW